MKLNIKLTSGLKFSTEFSGTTVLECKQHLTNEHSCASPNQQRLVYKGRILDDAKKLIEDYEITEGSTLFLVSMNKDKPTTTNAASTAASTTASTGGSATSPPAAAAAAPDMSRLIQQMTQMQTQTSPSAPPPSQPTGSADPLSSLQDNPMLQSLMNENPEFLTNMLQSQMESNPAMRQLMESNPVVREALQDPAALRQMIQSMSNPDVRAQQQRHHDLALANIENMPGGFNMLRNMYETVQAPMEEAAVADANPTASNNTSDATAGATNQAMPNPWGSSRSNAAATPNPFGAAGANPFGASGGANPFAALGGANPFAAGGNPLAAMGATGQQPSREQQEAAITMLESNPQLQQMLSSSIRQNPGMIRQMMQSANPAAASMMNNMSDQQLSSMMEMVTNPTAMRGIMQMQEQMQGGNAMPGSNGMPNPFVSLMGGGAPNPFGGAASPFGAPAANPWASSSTPSQPPAVRYARQLEQMRTMGFDDEAAALSALERAGGNLNRAVDFLLEDNDADAN